MFKRNRIVYIILIFIVIALGISSRKFSELLPIFLSKYLGDTLWALMVFLIIGFIFNKKSTLFVGISAAFFTYMIEISQLYHAPWIDVIRNTTLGGLILGFGFLYSDIICYTVGILIGILLEKIYFIKNNN